MKEMKVKNLKVTMAAIGLGAALALSNATPAYAATNDEEVLYEETREDEGRVVKEPITEVPPATSYVQPAPVIPTPTPKDPASINGDCIDGDNYVVPEGRGDKIPEGEPTEKQRKFPNNPTPEPTPNPQPTDTPSYQPNTGTVATLTVNTPVAAPKTGDKNNILAEILIGLAGGSIGAGLGYVIERKNIYKPISKKRKK